MLSTYMDNRAFPLNFKILPLAMAICISLILFNGAAGAMDLNLSDIEKQNIQKLLTPGEKAWLSEHKSIRIAGPKAFPPFHYYEEDGTLKGMASDYIHLIFNYLDIRPDIQSNMEWATVLKGAEERKIDLISCSAKTVERESYLRFTEPYLSFPLVIITRTGSPFIGGSDDLYGKTVSFIKGAAAYDWIGQGKAGIIPYFVKTPLDALKAVSLGHSEAHIENLAAAVYLIEKHGLTNLKIAAPAFNENYNLYIAVRKDWPELVVVINKILAAMTHEQRAEIRNRWLSIKYEYGFRKADVVKWILGISCVVITILTLILIWNRRLTREIHERKQAEKEKDEARRIAAEQENYALVGRVAGKMAHDFNNILGAIMGNSELALLDCPHDQTKKKLALIFEQTIRGKNLTKNLVVFARDQEPKQEFFSIDEKTDLVLNLLKTDLGGIRVTRQYGHEMPDLLADPGMIEHAILNLVQNSIHALSLVEQPEITIRTYYQEEYIFLEIEDNGCGIPPEYIREIFEPAFTLKGSRDKNGMYKPGIKGTGYGMSNVKKYVDLHKGRISIVSEIKKGTKVVITLPVIKKELTDKELKKIKKEKPSFGKYILLVEDEQAISDVQYRILTQAPFNHKVDTAGSGQAAIDLLNRNQYDFISLDYMLPGKINGMDVYQHIRKTTQTLPILFISGNIEFLESIKTLKQQDPYIEHLSKPCRNVDYISCINKLFASLKA